MFVSSTLIFFIFALTFSTFIFTFASLVKNFYNTTAPVVGIFGTICSSVVIFILIGIMLNAASN